MTQYEGLKEGWYYTKSQNLETLLYYFRGYWYLSDITDNPITNYKPNNIEIISRVPTIEELEAK